jgi:hypothetical protein
MPPTRATDRAPLTATIPTTLTFGLGTDNRVWENAGTWASYPPAFNGWRLAG